MPSIDPNPFSLQGRSALVTGAGQGIGRGCALALAQAGIQRLLINDRPGSSTLQQTAVELRALGVEVHTVEADLFEESGIDATVQAAISALGQIDILVSNPAFSERGDFIDYPSDKLQQTLNGTFSSGFLLSQRVARHMIEHGGGGRILFISSVQARMPFARCAPYGAAKAALNQLARSMAVELCHHGITVNSIEPGWIDTPNERRVFTDAVIDAEAKKLPFQRLGTPMDIGHAVAFLASPAADYISGIVLPVDGLIRFQHLRSTSQPQEQKA